MKSFIIKLLNLFLIAAVLFGYQSYAKNRAARREAYEQEEQKSELAWEEARQMEEEIQKKEEELSQMDSSDKECSGENDSPEEQESESNTSQTAEGSDVNASSTEKQEAGQYQDGTYEGTGTGFGGEITVCVTIKDQRISSVEIEEAENETPEYLDMAKALLETIVEEQSPETDAVSGATFSSNGIMEATANALEQAK